MRDVYACAIAMLARREYGEIELQKKLLKKGYAGEEIHTTLQTCQQLGLQDDRRFAEQKTRARMAKGYGPERICLELKQLGIAVEVIDAVVRDDALDWLAHAQAVLQKKYRMSAADSMFTRQQQKQFLYYRGFSIQCIDDLFDQESIFV